MFRGGIIFLLDYDGKAAAIEIERNFIALHVSLGVRPVDLQDCDVERAANARLEFAVDVSERQRLVGRLAEIIHRGIESHLPGGQRAGLVAAERVDRAEILNRGEMLDHHLLARHAHRSPRQRDRRNHGQKFGRQSDRKRHGEDERFECGPVHGHAHHENE